jgi:ribonuclease E
MSKKMLIDAAHAEETRVVVTDGARVEEFDFESQTRKQLRGNIYLAKVTRVEPSLQAAFIEYGGNRHGFLAFNEIHPDYYQIPVADREALLSDEADDDEHVNGNGHAPVLDEDGEPADQPEISGASGGDEDDVVEEELARRRRRLMRRYKIQEVIRRRQIMLVQVVKEERGNKGAALTTYLSLAGRYGVLMPNTARGGGISRKIETATDRKRLKTIVQGLDVPQGMGLIVRTAGAKRTKLEIKRDYEYLMRMWENIREKTMESVAPALIYEEEDLVKRAIRDLFDKDLDGVWVEGEAGFREARDFMRMIMPSHAKKVQLYREATPLFVAHKVEGTLAQIYSPVVPLKSGGYLVINQTEALVAIDVNSGKATRERNIEATALKTNLEAAAEAARQMRLRDLAGLIVIDFIDMDEGKNNRAVEKVLKDALKDDRARVQMGKISAFGLMEISRQRRRTGVLEATTHVCEHCAGAGRVRTVESSALNALRAVEIEALKGGGEVTLKVSREVGLYILNEKRAYLTRIHQHHALFVTITIDERLGTDAHEIERTASGPHSLHAPPEPLAPLPAPEPLDLDDEVFEDEEEDDEEILAAEADEDEEGPRPAERESRERSGDREDGRGGRRRRRRRGGRRDDEERPAEASDAQGDDGDEDNDSEAALAGDDDDGARRRRRRGRRGGRRVREDTRPQDGFVWTRPRVPFDDPFAWHDPAELAANDRGRDRERPAAPLTQAEAAAAPVPATPEQAPEDFAVQSTAEIAPVSDFSGDIWVELPAIEAAPAKKPRRSRAKAKPVADEALAEAVETLDAAAPVAAAEAPPEPVVEAAPEPLPEPIPEVVLAAAEPEPVTEKAPDPAEISTPPAQPKRGWWRRG